MSEPLDVGIGTLNTVKQTAKGAAPDFTATTRPADRPKWIDGILDPAKTLAEGDYIEGRQFASPTVVTKQVNGEVGNIVIQAEPANAGIYLAYITASDTVTGSADPYTHTGTSDSTSAQPYIALAQVVGQNVGPKRDQFSDCKVGSLALSSSQDDPFLTFDMKINALASQTGPATTPAKTENAEDPYQHTETSGQISIDGTVLCEVSESSVAIDRKQSVFFGNQLSPCQIADGKAEITTIAKSIVTDQTLQLRNKLLYNQATPAAAVTPSSTVYMVSITRKYVRSATRSLQIDTPRVACNPADVKIGAKRDAGFHEISFGGKALRSGSTPALTWVAKTADAAAYVP